MEAGGAVPSYLIGIALVLLAAALLLTQARRQRPDFIGRVKVDAYRAMLRALFLILAGLLLALCAPLAGPLPPLGAVHVPRVAMALVAVGSSVFLARAALYTLRVKPQLDLWQAPAACPAGVAGDERSATE